MCSLVFSNFYIVPWCHWDTLRTLIYWPTWCRKLIPTGLLSGISSWVNQCSNGLFHQTCHWFNPWHSLVKLFLCLDEFRLCFKTCRGCVSVVESELWGHYTRWIRMLWRVCIHHQDVKFRHSCKFSVCQLASDVSCRLVVGYVCHVIKNVVLDIKVKFT